MTVQPIPAPTRTRAASPRPLRIALVNMPWARINTPSIQCGLLQAIARRHGHRCETHYLNLDFAALLGAAVYEKITAVSDERLHLLGEWLFSYSAFGEVRSELEYIEEFPETVSTWRKLTGSGIEHLIEMRRETIPDWIRDRSLERRWDVYDAIGFTSTHLQNASSIAFGRALKARLPHVALIYGGANFDGDMGPEFSRRVPCMDYVVSGEADLTFPRLLNQIAEGSIEPIPGVIRRGRPATEPTLPPELPREIDTLPIPDYRDYFDTLASIGTERLLGGAPVHLPIEFSRGCWWGEKHHCTFCGLNALGMAYRSKSAPRAIAELRDMLETYPTVHVAAVDNILDMRYIGSFCEHLAQERWDISLFLEVKANLDRKQLGALARAGVLKIQPGIESLNSKVLRLMRKGSTKLLNLRLLKWARYFELDVSWNILAGFPGETDADYEEQRVLLRHLHHLQPPGGCGRIWLERFSPYFTDDAFPILNRRPRPSYRHIYPPEIDVEKVAYFFDHEAADTCSDLVIERLNTAIKEWRERFRGKRRPRLFYQRLPGRTTVFDQRRDGTGKLELTGWQAAAFNFVDDGPHSLAAIRKHLATMDHDIDHDLLIAFLERTGELGLVARDEDKYLGLALPEHPGWLSMEEQPDAVEVGRAIATRLLSDEALPCGFVTGSQLAGLGTSTSDIDVYLVSGDKTPPRRQFHTDLVRVDVQGLVLSRLTEALDRFEGAVLRPDLAGLPISEPDLDLLVRLHYAQILKDDGTLSAARRRLRDGEHRLRALVANAWLLRAYASYEDALGFLASGLPIDQEAAALTAEDAVLCAGKALAASNGELYFGRKWVFRQIATIRPGLGPRYDLNARPPTRDRREAAVARLAFAQRVSAATAIATWLAVPVDLWPERACGEGPLRRSPDYFPRLHDDTITVVGPHRPHFRMSANAALLWSLCDGVSRTALTAECTRLGAERTAFAGLDGPAAASILDALVSNGLVIDDSRGAPR